MKLLSDSICKVCTSIFVMLVGIALLTPSLQAQGAYGAIVGTVTDASGAIVPGVAISLTNIGTNEKKNVQTDAAGNYRFLSLPPTQYKLEIEKSGYKRIVQSPVTVQVDATLRLDVALEVGAASETVEVTTQAPLLQTESGSLGSQVEGKTVEEMPLNGRNTMNLISLVPGVVPQGSSMGNTTMNQGTHTNNAGWGNFQIGGSIAGHGSMYLDGAPLNVLHGNFVAFVPTQDATQEFKVATNATSAEFGHFGGGVVEISSKSGNNQYHLSLYEYHRNTVFNANNWFTKKSQLSGGKPNKQAKWLQNQYGVSGSAPIIKNRAFLFGSWEKFSSRTASQTTTNVPDTLMMADANPSIPKNLTTSAALPASQASCLSYSASTGRTTIATSCLDPMGQIIKKYFHAPTETGVAVGSNNYSYLVPLGDDNWQINFRGDVNLTANQRLFGRYSQMETSDLSSADMQSANGFKTGGAISIYPTKQIVIGDTITLNSSTIADVRLSYTRSYFNDMPPSAGEDLKPFGFNTVWQGINAQQEIKQIPPLTINGGNWNFHTFRGFGVVQERTVNTYALNASLTKIYGNHTFKAGGQIFLFDNNALPQFQPGALTFSNSWYAKDEWANLLLGDLNTFNFSRPLRTTSYNWYQGYYLTDTWNATRKLTINVGLRWELPGVIAEKKDRGTVLLPNTDQIVNGVNVHGILALVNTQTWGGRGTEPSRKSLLSPRIGLAYRLTDKTVLRAGFALAYLPNNIALGVQPNNSPVNLAPTVLNNSASAVSYTLSNPLGTQSIIQPAGKSDANFLARYANVLNNGVPTGSVSSPFPTTAFSYMEQWNFTVGQQFKGDQSIEAGYAGAIGIHLPAVGQSGWNLNQLPQYYAAQLAAGTITTAQAYAARPHPAYNSFVDSNPLNGTMTYHSLQAKYTKRFGTSMINSSYTFSKSIGDTDTVSGFLDGGTIGGVQDYNNIKNERSLLSFSISQRWITSYILNLPFGKGHKWANNMNPVVDRMIGGWSINGITTLQTGQPLALTQSSGTYSNNFGAGTLRPDVVASCSKSVSGSAQDRISKWFNTACYAKAGVVQYGATSAMVTSGMALGNQSRVDSKLTGHGIANWDFTVQKATKITETSSLSFRAEFFNVFNRTQFGMPGANISSSTGFGFVTSQRNNPRQIQLSARFSF